MGSYGSYGLGTDLCLFIPGWVSPPHTKWGRERGEKSLMFNLLILVLVQFPQDSRFSEIELHVIIRGPQNLSPCISPLFYFIPGIYFTPTPPPPSPSPSPPPYSSPPPSNPHLFRLPSPSPSLPP